jgi:hypothetical protein
VEHRRPRSAGWGARHRGGNLAPYLPLGVGARSPHHRPIS